MKKKTYLILVFSLILFMLGVWVQAQNGDPDTTPPAIIDDLAVSTTIESSITLTWIAPGDDDMASTAASYDLRYSTSIIAESNWASASEVTNEPTPQVASSSETMTVSGLNEATTYYFAIKTKDEADNESGLSNIAEGTTLVEEEEPGPSSVFEMNVTPLTLNLKSYGKWIKVHLYVAAPHKASNVDISTVKLNDTLSPDLKYRGLDRFSKKDKHKEHKASKIEIRFFRSEFIELVASSAGDFEVTLTGEIDKDSFSASKTIRVIAKTSIDKDDDEDEEGEEEEEEEILVQAEDEPEVYAIKKHKRRHIPNPEAFVRHGYKWHLIKKISKEELDAYEDDELMKTSDNPAVYIIIAGMKRHIPSAEVFESYGFNWDDISIVKKSDLADYPEINLIRKAGDTKVYLLTGGKKHWIPTQAVFNKHGYKWENVIIVNSAEDDTVPEGENVE